MWSVELLYLSHGARGLVVLRVRLLDLRRHEVVVAARDEQQGPPIGVLVVDVGVVLAGMDVGERASPEDVARRGNVVALVELATALLGERAGERVLPLLERQAH